MNESPLILVCQSCGVRCIVNGEVTPCEQCHGVVFLVDGFVTTFPQRYIKLTDPHTDDWGFRLSVDDRQFLASIHITSSV
jgi:hypothetical protein